MYSLRGLSSNTALSTGKLTGNSSRRRPHTPSACNRTNLRMETVRVQFCQCHAWLMSNAAGFVFAFGISRTGQTCDDASWSAAKSVDKTNNNACCGSSKALYSSVDPLLSFGVRAQIGAVECHGPDPVLVGWYRPYRLTDWKKANYSIISQYQSQCT